MIRDKLLNQRNQISRLSRRGEHNLFFCCEMHLDFALKLLCDLGLPCSQIVLPDRGGSTNANAQSQRVLVLPGKRNQVLVA